jgi:serine/threonine protein kinase
MSSRTFEGLAPVATNSHQSMRTLKRNMKKTSSPCKKRKLTNLEPPVLDVDLLNIQKITNNEEILGEFSGSPMFDSEQSCLEENSSLEIIKCDSSLTLTRPPYAQHGRLGFGTQGSVYLVTWLKDGQLYALKVMDKLEKLSSTKNLYHHLKAPNIISSYKVFSYQDRIHILLEYMDCGSLENVYKKAGKIPEKELSHIAYQLLCGLTYLEKIGIVHRDIKPANILLNSQGQVKISDFDLCKQLTQKNLEYYANNCVESTVQDKNSNIVGTINYMSPEDLKAQPNLQDSKKLAQNPSFKRDIWSLGVTIAECALGKNPFSKDYNEVIWNPESYVSEKLAEIKDQLSEELFDFLQHAMEVDPEKRYTAERLLGHKWILQHHNTEFHYAVAQWLQKYFSEKK